MDHLNTIYRSFDIRGKFPEEITPEEVTKIGQAIVTHFKLKKVAVGRDIRPSADTLFEALSAGIRSQGADVIDLGLVTTPMTYYMCGSSDVDATVMITASHMPPEYNGLKICTEDAKPVPGDMLQVIREIVGTHTFSAEETLGNVSTHALQPEWIQTFKAQHDLGDTQYTVVIDPANMIGALEIETFRAFSENLTIHTIFEDFDPTCPNHEANPLKTETLADLQAAVCTHQADLGVAFDGDADRVGILDEKGNPVPNDIIGMLLAEMILKTHPGATVVCDIRSSKALPELIESLGGTVIRNRVGHTFIRKTMREHDAVFGVELSGHFFFKENFYSEGGPLPVFLLLELMKESGLPLSALVEKYQKYVHSTEINSTIIRTQEAIYKEIQTTYPEATVEMIDGLSLITDTWWCNVRPSANDPVMRLNLEAVDQDTMEQMRDEVLKIIRS